MTREAFLALFSEEELEHLAHVGIDGAELEKMWEFYISDLGDDVHLISQENMRKLVFCAAHLRLQGMLDDFDETSAMPN